MKEYIEKEAVLKNQRWNGRLDEYVVFVKDIESVPAADVEEVCHGKWMEVEVTNGEDIETHFDIVSMRCNKCHRYHATIFYYGNPTEMMHYCPHCGAKMDGGGE